MSSFPVSVRRRAVVAAGRKAEAISAAEQAVMLAHPNEPRPRQALAALKK
jgi:hypothetical protein